MVQILAVKGHGVWELNRLRCGQRATRTALRRADVARAVRDGQNVVDYNAVLAWTR